MACLISFFQVGDDLWLTGVIIGVGYIIRRVFIVLSKRHLIIVTTWTCGLVSNKFQWN